MKQAKLYAIASLMAFMTACSKDDKNDKKNQEMGPFAGWGIFGVAPQNESIITVTDGSKNPIAGARVLIGDLLNNPFQGNYLTTDANGQVVVPEAWTSTASVTVDAPGFIRQTQLSVEPGSVQFQLRRLQTEAQVEVKGVTSGHPIVSKDDIIDFSVVMPGMSRQDLLSFDIGKVISPQNDTISILGNEVNIPSNVSIPRQRESYIFPVTIDKPTYRVYFREPGVQRVFAARGRFKFHDVVDKMRGGEEFYNLVNDFQINGGVIRDIQANRGSNPLDLVVTELNFTDKVNVQAPGMNKDQVMLAVTAADMNGLLIPTDIKKLQSGQKISMNLLPNSNSVQLSVLKNMNEFDSQKPGADRLSAVIGKTGVASAPKFLNLIASPSFDKAGALLFNMPNPVDGIASIATYSILSEVTIVGSGDNQSKKVRNVWEIYSKNWINKMVIPKWPVQISDKNMRRWEVTFIGSQVTNSTEIGPQLLDSATHVTHSSIDF